MKLSIRPFQHIRYEYEQRHIYYLPPGVMQRLEAAKPVYLSGTRGTGKTTLLKALEWRERLYNRSLQRELQQDPFAERYVGVYLKLPKFHLEAFEKNLPRTFESAYEVLIGLYLDIIGLQPLCIALSELASVGILKFTPEEEFECVSNVLSEHSFLRPQDRKVEMTLLSLKELLFKIQRQLEMCALHGRELSENVLVGITAIGELGRTIGVTFGKLCNPGPQDNPWHFKICMDEAETLGTQGRKILNTIVRSSEEPLIHVAAFVGVFDSLVQTCQPNLSLAEEDRTIIDLNQMTDSDFVGLAEGVATARLREAANDVSISADFGKILGRLDLPGLATAIAKDSVNHQARKWLALAESNSNTDILEVFLSEVIEKVASSTQQANWEQRRTDSMTKRKLLVAAYLGFCKTLSTSPRYASSEMLIQMSDCCIRDCLRFLNEIYLETGVTSESFCALSVQPKLQDVAIKRASKLKIDGLHQSGVNEPIVAHRLIDALAKLTTELQTSGEGGSNYRSPERGLFKFEADSIPLKDRSWLVSLLMDAAEAGFLILKEHGPKTWVFRVHASLAAAYGFSYRGAYYQIKVHPADLLLLAKNRG